VTEIALSSSTGHTVSQTTTDASVLVIAASDAESGYAEATSWKADELDPAAVAREAAEKAARTRGAVELEPGTHAAVLEPYAFSELLWYFGFSSLGALAFLEGRSYVSGRLGEKLFHESFTLVDDGLDPRGLPKAFDLEGAPKQRVPLVEAGVAKDVVWDRRTARRAGNGRSSSGHGLAAPAQGFGPLPLNLSVASGDATRDELVARVGEGIYVTRLHYLGVVDPREGIITGMTRDGTFRIEGGKVTKPLVNLRFTTSFPKLVERLVGLGNDVELVNRSDFYDERYPFGTLVPTVATQAFTIVGTGSGPGL
jgi:predicted Zn-dependent protease